LSLLWPQVGQLILGPSYFLPSDNITGDLPSHQRKPLLDFSISTSVDAKFVNSNVQNPIQTRKDPGHSFSAKTAQQQRSLIKADGRRNRIHEFVVASMALAFI
jgi:hypothetical protein